MAVGGLGYLPRSFLIFLASGLETSTSLAMERVLLRGLVLEQVAAAGLLAHDLAACR